MNNRELRTLFFNCTGETSSTNSGRFIAFCAGVSSQQSELDKANARIAQLEEDFGCETTIPTYAWLLEHDKAVESMVLGEVVLKVSEFQYIGMSADIAHTIPEIMKIILVMIEARKSKQIDKNG